MTNNKNVSVFRLTGQTYNNFLTQKPGFENNVGLFPTQNLEISKELLIFASTKIIKA